MATEKALGSLIKTYRLSNGISQEKLAELCNLDRTYISLLERGLRSPTVNVMARIAISLDIKLSDLFKELESLNNYPNKENNEMYNYIVNESANIIYNGEVILTKGQIVEAVLTTNANLKKLSDITNESGVQVFEALGMRNLSGFIGEFFVSSLEMVSNQDLAKNPHQDGYPDLLLIKEEAQEYFDSIVDVVDGKLYPKEKSLFSPFKYGGLEVKATCGSTPSAKVLPKPLIGEQRVHILTGFDWKAHHRETNNLISIYWDFLHGLPTICAVFYRNDLTENDWGKIVQPKEDGGRTTSVSIMNSGGVKKMCENWIAVIDNEDYTNKLANRKWIGYNVKEHNVNII